jgi:hypothetical protein
MFREQYSFAIPLIFQVIYFFPPNIVPLVSLDSPIRVCKEFYLVCGVGGRGGLGPPVGLKPLARLEIIETSRKAVSHAPGGASTLVTVTGCHFLNNNIYVHSVYIIKSITYSFISVKCKFSVIFILVFVETVSILSFFVFFTINEFAAMSNYSGTIEVSCLW